MELPIDHFRLLGVSPSADAEEVLRFFQLRLNRIPHPGFTPEVIAQRSELLRLSADLLCDKDLREDYESALLNGAVGLDLSFNREVAGLILLWEGGVADEAFKLARKALQPPQTPALGSGREADLALIGALACRDAAIQEQELRRYASAAELLEEGIQLLQRMGKLPEQRKIIERDLEVLLPYRILDLLSRDLSDEKSHEEGLNLLDSLVLKRGGLEGDNLSNSSIELSQREFELFFQQIRNFLTAQEQIDLFLHWQRRGSPDAGFLGALALVASGFHWRKPEFLQKAKKQLKALNQQGFDSLPLLGCIDLLLADVQQAGVRFKSSPDKGLQDWLNAYPGEELAALCHYCRNWLLRDVLPGFRDIEIDTVDLEAWFADRDVQEYVEQIERRGAFGIARAGFSLFSGLSSDKTNDSINSLENDSTLSNVDEIEKDSEKNNKYLGSPEEELSDEKTFLENLVQLLKWRPFYIEIAKPRIKIPENNFFKATLALFLLLFSGTFTALILYRNNPTEDNISESFKEPSEKIVSKKTDINLNIKQQDQTKLEKRYNTLTNKSPSKDEVQQLIEAWLSGKAGILSGVNNLDLSNVARPSLVKIVLEQREKDIALGERQIIYANIKSLEIEEQTEKRISVKAILNYKDQRVNSSDQIISETTIPSLKLKYVLGREKNIWQLLDFSSST